jgi:hypothetical protein
MHIIYYINIIYLVYSDLLEDVHLSMKRVGRFMFMDKL